MNGATDQRPARARPGERARARRTVVAALATGLFVALLAVPPAWRGATLWPDSVHYLGIANAWLHGAGFVDPVKWNYYLAAPVPQPAMLVRPPVPSLLAAIPLALGASVAAIAGWHAALLAFTAAGLVLFARGMMGLTASVCAALLVTVSPVTAALSQVPLADVPALLVLLLVLASARGVVRSPASALLCAAATLVGWATRPNLVLVAVAVVAVAVWHLGARRALRSVALWTYVVALLAALLAVDVAVRRRTGAAPYAGYGFMYQMLTYVQAANYGYDYVGTSSFVRTHLADIARLALGNARELASALFGEEFQRIGWILVPGVAWCLLRGGRGSFERRLCALSAAGFALVVIATWMTFDPMRYPLPIVLCGGLCGVAMLDDLVRVARRRFFARDSRVPAVVAATVLTSVAVPWLVAGGYERLAAVGTTLAYWSRGGEAAPPARRGLAALPALCKWIAPGAVVAARDPWSLHLVCGNPAIMLPADLGRPTSRRARFFAEQKPRYVVAAADDGRSGWLAGSSLQLVAQEGKAALYELRRAHAAPAVWKQPPPLMCAGRPPTCAADVGR